MSAGSRGGRDEVVTIGVITATCNRQPLLARAIVSLEAQTYRHWVAVVVDDSTTTQTLDWFRDTDIDARITYVRNEANRGVGFSRNRGLDLLLPRVDFVTTLDDDDYLRPSTLAHAAAAIDEHPDDRWFMSRHVNAGTGLPITVLNESRRHYNYWTDLAAGDAIAGDRNFFIASELIRETGARFPEDVDLGGEWRFYGQLSRSARIRFFEGGETLGEYLADGLSARQVEDLDFLRSELLARLRFGRSLDLTDSERVSAERNLTSATLRHVVRYVRAGQLMAGLPMLRALDYRIALRSSEFYSGVYSVASAIVHHRLDSGRAGAVERALIKAGRAASRGLNAAVRGLRRAGRP